MPAVYPVSKAPPVVDDYAQKHECAPISVAAGPPVLASKCSLANTPAKAMASNRRGTTGLGIGPDDGH